MKTKLEKNIKIKNVERNLITLTASEDDEFPTSYQNRKNNFSPHFAG